MSISHRVIVLLEGLNGSAHPKHGGNFYIVQNPSHRQTTKLRMMSGMMGWGKCPALALTLRRTLLESLRVWFPNTLRPQTLAYWPSTAPSPGRCSLVLVVPSARRAHPLLPLAFADAPPRRFANHRGAVGLQGRAQGAALQSLRRGPRPRSAGGCAPRGVPTVSAAAAAATSRRRYGPGSAWSVCRGPRPHGRDFSDPPALSESSFLTLRRRISGTHGSPRNPRALSGQHPVGRRCALSLLWRVLWLEAQAPPSAGTNRRERRGRLLSSHRRGGPGRVRGSVPTFPVWEWSRPVVLPGRSIAPLSRRSPVAWGGAGCEKATVKLPKLLETFPSEKSGKLQFSEA